MRIRFRCDPTLIDWLPRPEPARAALPAWLRGMAPRRHSEVHGREIRTLKQCPPFVDAMAHGFVLPLPCDIRVDHGRFAWDWPGDAPATPSHPRAPLSFHVPEQIEGSPLAHAGRSAIKFTSFWTIELEPGWSLMATHPVNRDDLPFRLATGLVDADRFNAIGINFPGVWTDPGFCGVLARGTPFAQCWPVRREAIELDCAAMTADDIAGYEALSADVMAGPGVYRKRFRRKPA